MQSYITLRRPQNRSGISALLGESDSFWPPSVSFPRLFDDLVTTSRFEADETDEGYAFTIALPGFKKNEVKVTVDGQQLTVAATSEKKGTSMSRSITLPSDVDTASIEATLEDGVLTVTTKKRPESRARQIEVK